MSPTLRWIAAPPASPLHAAAMFASSQPFADAELAARLAPAVAAIDDQLHSANADREQFWRDAVPWGAGVANSTSPELHAALASALKACDADIDGEELRLRSGPLRDAWEARGPGLWRALRHIAQDDEPAPAVSLILVRPVLGGGGTAFPRHAAVSFEAMLASPQRELPEVVRLAWLVAQLRFASGPSVTPQASLALIPPLLAAAEEVELARCDLPTLGVALRAWHLEQDDEKARGLASRLWARWQTVQDRPRRLAEAMADFSP